MPRHGRQFLIKSQWTLQKLHSNCRPYQYSPLNDENREIRLLTLLPGQFSSEVRVCLETTPFTEEVIPQFEALSYAWGSTENPVNIYIGPSGSHALAVTRNLAEALPYLRYKDRPRVLWIDAICVNQHDFEERGRQVLRMPDIFSKAARVVVWLGRESDDTSVAIDCIQVISSHVKMNWGRSILVPLQASAEGHWTDRHEMLPFEEPQLVAICNLINRPWFKRLWIWQEIKLSTSDAIAMCGTQTILWNSLRTTVACLYLKPSPPGIYSRFKDQRDLLWNLCRKVDARLGKLIEFTKSTLCSDPRDRIFAILSLLRDSEKHITIEPDYTKNVHKVYEQTALKYIKYTRKLRILTSVEMHHDVEELPSWVPDWSISRSTRPMEMCFASENTLAITYSQENRILEVTGVVVGIVEQVAAFNLPESALHGKWHSRLIEVLSGMGFGQLNKEDKQLRVLCRVLSSNTFAEAYSPPYTYVLTIEQSEDALYSLLQNPPTRKRDFSSKEKIFLQAVRWYCSNRSLFLTKDKQVGLGPSTIEADDIASVFLGCGSCMILRPIKNDQFQVVGEAFCEGFMEGQAMTGSLPNNFDLVFRYNERKQYYFPLYHDRETNTFHPEHPNLAPLPVGWTRKSHSDEEFLTLFESEETGETTSGDPRLEPEALKARGVKLRVFSLV